MSFPTFSLSQVQKIRKAGIRLGVVPFGIAVFVDRLPAESVAKPVT